MTRTTPLTASVSNHPSISIDTLATKEANLIDFNTMRLACMAEMMVTLTAESEIIESVKALSETGLPLLVLSGGSNVILPSRLQSCVIRPMLRGIKVVTETADTIDIEVMSGENWHELVTTTVGKGWYGLENLALIPGLTGAAPVQNIGAYGVQLEDVVTHVKALHLPTLTWYDFDKSQCQFAYRDSKFKQESGQWLITRLGLRLLKDATIIRADYGDVATLAAKLAQSKNTNVTPVEVMEAIISIRQEKLPDPSLLPNCGSFFKNPVIETTQFNHLQKKFSKIVGYRVDDAYTKVAAGWLIDAAGLKGDGIAPIMTHKQQALVLVNHADQGQVDTNYVASQLDVLATQQFIQQRVQQIFGIELVREPVWIS